VNEPVFVVHFRKVLPIMIQAPAALGSKERCPRSHLGAVSNKCAFHGSHEIVRFDCTKLLDLFGRSDKILQPAL
jgi:hypothetical protein